MDGGKLPAETPDVGCMRMERESKLQTAGYLQTSHFIEHDFAEKQICTVPPASRDVLKGGGGKPEALSA